jgi:aminoglycoside/choline kinase family phosphotransferase
LAAAFKLTPAQDEFLNRSIPGFCHAGWSVNLAAQAGSERRFIRVRKRSTHSHSYIMIVWDAGDADWPRFISIAREVASTHALLPAIYAAEPGHGLILEEDLGDKRLKNAVAKQRSAMQREGLYCRVLDALALWHSHKAGPGSSVAGRCMDEDMFLWESGYFSKHCATEYFGLEKMLDASWNEDCVKLAREAARLPHVCMHRDFQSENVMVTENGIRFVDFQGARLGPAEYDLAALVFDPYVPALDCALSDRLFAYYSSHSSLAITRRGFLVAATQRLLQALGAFSNLSLHKGKDWYREFIPVARKRLCAVLEETNDFPAISAVVEACRAD